ncbi:restriction endonuclease subunit S [Enterococcus faecalis]
MSNDTRPEIRFPGFTEDWEERKLGDISDVTKLAGFEFTKYVTYSDEGEVIALRGLNVKNGNLVLDEVKYIDGSDFSKLNRSRLYKNDILFTYVGTVGELAVVPEDDKYYLAPNVARIRMNEGANPLFVSKLMNDKTFYNKIILPLIATSSQPALSMENVRKFTLMMPEIEEQEKIAVFLGSLDNLIFLHQRKLDLLKETKKGFLQKMFPKNGAKVPEIRFPGFTENWEEKKFKEVINSGIKGKAKAEMSGTKSLYLDTNYLNGGVVTYVDSPRDVENDDVLILWDGSQAGTVYYGFSGALGSTLKAYRAKESGAFLYQQLKRNQQIIYDRYRTPNIPHVVKTFTDEFMVSMPSSEEQQKIGTFFKQLDDTIALHQRKLDLLKETKKGFLQKMFV